MLASRTCAFVCLQCRLRASTLLRTRPIPQRGSIACFSSTPLRSQDDEALLEQPPQTRKPLRVRRPRNIRDRRNGDLYSEDSEQLSIESLGTPSEIIVLRDAQRDYFMKKLQGVGDHTLEDPIEDKKESKQEEAPKQNDIFASWQEENSTPEQGEVNAQIEGLRPKLSTDPSDSDGDLYLSIKEYQRLHEVLYNGFTGPQLSRYFADSTGIVTTGDDENVIQGLIKASGTNKSANHQTEWRPGTSPISTRLPGGNAGMLTRTTKQRGGSKRLLVDQILRRAWHISLIEEIEAPGELEISLKRWQLSLLFAGDAPTPLDRIGESRRAKMEIYWPHHVLRITADKNSAEYAARDVEAVLKGTSRLQLNLEPWRPFLAKKHQALSNLNEVFKPQDIAFVERMAGVIVQMTTKSSLLVRGIDSASTANGRRSLLSMLQLKGSSPRVGLTTAVSASAREGSTFIGSSSKTALDYVHRDLDLVRWTLPVARSTNAEETIDSTPDTKMESDEFLLKRVRKYLDRPTPFTSLHEQALEAPAQGFEAPRWSARPEFQLTAKFGQILHPAKYPKSLLSKFDNQGINTTNAKTVFSNIVPGLSQLISKCTAPAGTLNLQNHLEYQFVASPIPENSLNDRNKYPRLSVRVTINPDGQVRSRGARLDIYEDFTEVFLPDQVTDVRFRRRLSSYLYRADAHANIADYVQAITENIKFGGRLSAPSTLKLEIPAWSILSSKYTPLERYQQGPADTETLEWTFLGIQHQQSVLIPYGTPTFEPKSEDPYHFGAHTLTYSAVEAGQLAGKFGELALKHSSKNKTLAAESKTVKRRIHVHFLETALDVARRLGNESLNENPFEAKNGKPIKTRSLGMANKIKDSFPRL